MSDFDGVLSKNHSSMILSELMDVIIGAKELLTVSSQLIESKVLFHLEGDVPEVEEVILHAIRMHNVFNEALHNYINTSICPCAACSSADQLYLRLVVHSGDITFITVKDNTKLHGPAVILANKLLNNDLEESDCILFTDKLLGDAEIVKLSDSKLKVQRTKMNYKDLGEIEFNYIALHNKKPELEKSIGHLGTKSKFPIRKQVYIEQLPEIVYEVLSNLKYRLEWNTHILEVKYDETKLNRVGIEHVSVIQNREVIFETVTNNFGENKIVYGERSTSTPFVKELTNYFILENVDGRTKLTNEIHFVPKRGVKKLVMPIFKIGLAKNMDKVLASLKVCCEGNKLDLEESISQDKQ